MRCFEKDGWSALWAETFHGQKFWKSMPRKGSPVRPPDHVRQLYEMIPARKGSASGCFDVVAGKDLQIVWADYEGPKDKPNRNEQLRVNVALDPVGLPQHLLLVGSRPR